jgi:hypothetical protein
MFVLLHVVDNLDGGILTSAPSLATKRSVIPPTKWPWHTALGHPLPGLLVLRPLVRLLNRLHAGIFALVIVRIHDPPAQLDEVLVLAMGCDSRCNSWMSLQAQLHGKPAPLPQVAKILHKLPHS